MVIIVIIFRLGQSNLHQKFYPDSERNNHPGKNKLSGNLPPSKEIKCYPPVFFSITMKPLFLESQANLWSLQHPDSNKQPSTKNYTQIHEKTTYTNQPRRLSGPAVRRLSGLVVAWIRVKLKGSDSPNTSRELRVGGGGNLRNLQNERSDGVFGKRYLIFKYLETLCTVILAILCNFWDMYNKSQQ